MTNYFANCNVYLKKEIELYRPSVVLTLGEPALKLFRTILDNPKEIEDSMQASFTGKFTKLEIEGIKFEYSPCLHIQTFRVAEEYGDSVKSFKKGLRNYFLNICDIS